MKQQRVFINLATEPTPAYQLTTLALNVSDWELLDYDANPEEWPGQLIVEPGFARLYTRDEAGEDPVYDEVFLSVCDATGTVHKATVKDATIDEAIDAAMAERPTI